MLLILLTGAFLLLAGLLLTHQLRLRREADIPFYVRLHRDDRTIRLLRRILRQRAKLELPPLLCAAAPRLMAHLRQMNRRIGMLPPLPASDEGEPRLMDAARDAADGAEVTCESLLAALADKAFTPDEVLAFPVAVARAQSQRLAAVLTAFRKDAAQLRLAARLLRKLRRSKHPERLLARSALNSCGLHHLYRMLPERQQDPLLPVAGAHLAAHELSPDALAAAAAKRAQRYEEELRRAQDTFSALERLNWPDICSRADDAHTLLLADPGGIYPRMDNASQLQLRLDISAFSRHTGVTPTQLIRNAYILCGLAGSSLESCVCYYFQTPQGMLALHRSLHTRRGGLYARLALRPEALYYALRWGVSLLAGFGFLQSGQPVFILPFFAILTGGFLGKPARMHHHNLPGMSLSPQDDGLRTLVVLHAEMAEPEDALHAVQRLQTILRAFQGEAADFLLLGDHTPCITAVSGFDLPIMQTAASAVAALEDSRVMYLHRGRAWDDAAHCYRARAGLRGALTEVCRLISTGESRDALAHTSVLPSSLERRYAYLLCLGRDAQPAPGLLTRFLSVMTHPLCQPYPTQKGLHGHALLLPEGWEAFDGTGFLRPDAFLEAVDGLLHDHRPADGLCGELAGQLVVRGAQAFRTAHPHPWEAAYHRALAAWRFLPWQLPVVSTPQGWVDNPLGFLQRFHLREQLRQTLLPLSQLVLLLWGILTENPPLMLLSLLPEIGRPLPALPALRALLSRLSLLPTRAAIGITALVQLLRRRAGRPPGWPALEAWTQGLTATLMAALAFLLPTFSVHALILAVLFALFPLTHRWLDA